MYIHIKLASKFKIDFVKNKFNCGTCIALKNARQCTSVIRNYVFNFFILLIFYLFCNEAKPNIV